MTFKYRIALASLASGLALGTVALPAAQADDSMMKGSMHKTMKKHGKMKGGAMKGDAMKGDAMKGDAMQGGDKGDAPAQ